MAAMAFLALLVQSILQFPQMVGYELDEVTRERMQQREEYLTQQMNRLLQELEQKSQAQSGFARSPPLFPALHLLQFWVIAVILVLVLRFWWLLTERTNEPDSSDEEEEVSSSDSEQVQDSEEEDNDDDANELRRFFEEHIPHLAVNPATDCQTVKDLVGNLILVFKAVLADSLFPELQSAIGVGSAFEGWSPQEEVITYHVLVPMKAPLWHSFHLELCDTGEMQTRNFRIRVEQECLCTRERLVGDMLCFLHHSEEELRRNQKPSLLSTLCTGSYLDVQKTARWFHQLVKAAWVALPQASSCRLKMMPFNRSCKFQVTKTDQKRFIIELMFGVQQGDSDIFVTSESTEAIFTPSTMWTESCAVAEAKFFRHMATQAPHDSFHVKCLQVYTHILVGTDFSDYTLKTVVMHLLSTIPVSSWSRKEFLMRLQDIMWHLRSCLEEKRLDHFFSGNENVPKEIILPPAFQTAEPLNLFKHLAQDPDAHAQALYEFSHLQDRLTRLLFYGH
ncbi:inositol -trisphosphate receptor-interacting 1 [Limosa lapponica baueri]|uniref:Inositol-trisphosphate receptor-interacting 1 n=1 Tax=Limosa lapponica baueri TaxID=1758121 RepID=A0A2I0UFE0_LIMLA|nr:inositol -trisphosphate receptor-interacting 1 [Limosa lapponica baueri]